MTMHNSVVGGDCSRHHYVRSAWRVCRAWLGNGCGRRLGHRSNYRRVGGYPRRRSVVRWDIGPDGLGRRGHGEVH